MLTDSELDQNRKPSETQRHGARPPETPSTETRRSSGRGKQGQTGAEEKLLSYQEATAGETEKEDDGGDKDKLEKNRGKNRYDSNLQRKKKLACLNL